MGKGRGSRNREGKWKGIGKEGEEKGRKERKGKQRGNIRGTGIGNGKEEMRGRRAMGGIKGVKRERREIAAYTFPKIGASTWDCSSPELDPSSRHTSQINATVWTCVVLPL